MKDLIKELILKIGEDPQRPGLLNTPERVEATLRYLTQGYKTKIEDIINGALFEEEADEIIMVKHINFYSLCEHHLLPFFGVCSVGYLPDKKLIGLSKIPRIVDMYARRLQLQERLTNQIARCLEEVLQPKGVAVVTEAYHLCMIMRGVEKQDSRAMASAMLGVFRTNPQTRMEFLNLLGVKTIEA